MAKKSPVKVDLKGKVKEQLKKVSAHFKQAEVKVHTAIKKNPEKAALIAAGVGAVIGAAVTAAILHKKKNK